MSLRKYLLGAASVVTILGSQHAFAQTASVEQVAKLEQQIIALEKKLNAVQKKTFINANAGYVPTKAQPFPKPEAIVKMPGNRPTICTADEANCIALTGRLHYDFGGHSYRPDSAATSQQDARTAGNARRAQIGVAGKFARDWTFALSIDAGGTTDGDVGLHNAWIAYNGFKNTILEAGYMNVNYTLDQATSSNNTQFMERSTASVLSTDIGANDFRAAAGARFFGDRWFAAAYITGHKTGPGSVNNWTRQPVASTYRLVGLPIHNEQMTLLLGVDAQLLHDAGAATAATADQIRLRDRIEVRIDPTLRLLDTGTLNNVNSARILSGEAALNIGSFYGQAEYFNYNIQRFGQSDLTFNGGYIQGGYVLTGEKRSYSKSSGTFGGIKPKADFDYKTGNWGAWEVAARYTYVDLNDQNILGGKLSNTTVGVNWYMNQNMRMMFNWIHGDVAKVNGAGTPNGGKYDAFAARAQFAF